eukprot:356123-Chlamydomonas_euryale.AAC.16
MLGAKSTTCSCVASGPTWEEGTSCVEVVLVWPAQHSHKWSGSGQLNIQIRLADDEEWISVTLASDILLLPVPPPPAFTRVSYLVTSPLSLPPPPTAADLPRHQQRRVCVWLQHHAGSLRRSAGAPLFGARQPRGATVRVALCHGRPLLLGRCVALSDGLPPGCRLREHFQVRFAVCGMRCAIALLLLLLLLLPLTFSLLLLFLHHIAGVFSVWTAPRVRRCGRKLVRADYPNLQAWLRDVWQLRVPGASLQV